MLLTKKKKLSCSYKYIDYKVEKKPALFYKILPAKSSLESFSSKS